MKNLLYNLVRLAVRVGVFGVIAFGLWHLYHQIGEPGYPETPVPVDRLETNSVSISGEGVLLLGFEDGRVPVRAIAPEPTIVLDGRKAPQDTEVTLDLSNVNLRLLDREQLAASGAVTVVSEGAVSMMLRVRVPQGNKVTIPIRLKVGDDFRFAVAGDTRRGYESLPRIAERVKSENVAFWVVTGDIVNEWRWEFLWFRHVVGQSGVPVYVAMGNHDYMKYLGLYDDPVAEFRGRLNPTWYSFDFRGNRFVILNTGGDLAGMEEKDWKGALKMLEAKNLYIFMHKPLRDPRPGHDHAIEDKAAAERLTAILKGRADEVRHIFSGHVQGYWPGTTVEGMPVTVSGGGGERLRGDGERYHHLLVNVQGGTPAIEKIDGQIPSKMLHVQGYLANVLPFFVDLYKVQFAAMAAIGLLLTTAVMFLAVRVPGLRFLRWRKRR